MGQSAVSRQNRRSAASLAPTLSIFATGFGWCGIAGSGRRVQHILIGHSSAQAVRQGFQQRLLDIGLTAEFQESDWHPQLRRRLEQYGLGKPVSFDDIELDLPSSTEFQSRVRKATRSIPYGEKRSYGELADLAGYPRAARAVGSVMAGNRLPILIPCHRVVASAGKLGGFSAPQGLDLKSRLLEMEAEGIQTPAGAVKPRSRRKSSD
jgi:O-6-methylguanine DNA methyltransferase